MITKDWQADCARDPTEIYRFMDHHCIGRLFPAFYVAWAMYYHSCKALRDAKAVLELGVGRYNFCSLILIYRMPDQNSVRVLYELVKMKMMKGEQSEEEPRRQTRAALTSRSNPAARPTSSENSRLKPTARQSTS